VDSTEDAFSVRGELVDVVANAGANFHGIDGFMLEVWEGGVCELALWWSGLATFDVDEFDGVDEG